jgi:hypothetical protein
MRTGRFRFTEYKRWFRRTVLILEVEVKWPVDQHCTSYVCGWIDGTKSDAQNVIEALNGKSK